MNASKGSIAFALVVLARGGCRRADRPRPAPGARPSSATTSTPCEALLKQRVDVNAAQPDGATALHWAAHWDDVADGRTAADRAAPT